MRVWSTIRHRSIQTNSRHGYQFMSKSLSTTAAAFAVVMLFTAGNTHAGDKAATADEQALRKLEREWVDAETRHDAVALQSILDDKFVATFGAAKPLDKDAFIKDVTAGPVLIQRSARSCPTRLLSWPATLRSSWRRIRSAKSGMASHPWPFIVLP